MPYDHQPSTSYLAASYLPLRGHKHQIHTISQVSRNTFTPHTSTPALKTWTTFYTKNTPCSSSFSPPSSPSRPPACYPPAPSLRPKPRSGRYPTGQQTTPTRTATPSPSGSPTTSPGPSRCVRVRAWYTPRASADGKRRTGRTQAGAEEEGMTWGRRCSRITSGLGSWTCIRSGFVLGSSTKRRIKADGKVTVLVEKCGHGEEVSKGEICGVQGGKWEINANNVETETEDGSS
ncbi:hypothetical protein QBC47DRAFT_380601 [Echria macrotheca]|uniref:Uncharacterized protein n=1 Tax=Echria macrotheca TaxID=438768 RepID=A0AAJ0F9M6_9PEZI|nr:hypothetical protein QBC47DRAFT_380601 [Echria macrotheca]